MSTLFNSVYVCPLIYYMKRRNFRIKGTIFFISYATFISTFEHCGLTLVLQGGSNIMAECQFFWVDRKMRPYASFAEWIEHCNRMTGWIEHYGRMQVLQNGSNIAAVCHFCRLNRTLRRMPVLQDKSNIVAVCQFCRMDRI